MRSPVNQARIIQATSDAKHSVIGEHKSGIEESACRAAKSHIHAALSTPQPVTSHRRVTVKEEKEQHRKSCDTNVGPIPSKTHPPSGVGAKPVHSACCSIL